MGVVKANRIDLLKGYTFATCPICKRPIREGQSYRYNARRDRYEHLHRKKEKKK